MNAPYKILSLVAASLATLTLPASAALSKNFESQASTAKQEEIWRNILSSQYPGEPPSKRPNPAVLFNALINEKTAPGFDVKAFTWPGDELEPHRVRVIHNYGVVGKVSWLPTRAPHGPGYTGIFATGGVGLARLSLAHVGLPFTPGMGLKIFVDGKPSVNFQVMYSLDGQDSDLNFFSNSFTNIVERPKTLGKFVHDLAAEIVQKNFASAIAMLAEFAPENVRTLPLEEAAAVDSRGGKTADPKSPYEVQFAPADGIADLYRHELAQLPSQDASDGHMRDVLQKLPINTVLYTVGVRTKEERDQNKSFTEIGHLILKSKLIASKYGDETIYFRHQRLVKPLAGR